MTVLETTAPDRPRRLEKLELAGIAAVAEGVRLFDYDIWDPPTKFKHVEAERWRNAIDQMIRTEQGLDWDWLPRYTGDGEFEWCGAFVSSCYASSVRLDVRRTYFASCFRLHAMASYARANEAVENKRPKSGVLRQIVKLTERSGEVFFEDGSAPRAGDICLVGGINTGPGKHVTLVEHFDEKDAVFHTIEGNGRGLGPDGKPRQGVVRARRPLGLHPGSAPTTYHARWLIRLAPSDLV